MIDDDVIEGFEEFEKKIIKGMNERSIEELIKLNGGVFVKYPGSNDANFKMIHNDPEYNRAFLNELDSECYEPGSAQIKNSTLRQTVNGNKAECDVIVKIARRDIMYDLEMQNRNTREYSIANRALLYLNDLLKVSFKNAENKYGKAPRACKVVFFM